MEIASAAAIGWIYNFSDYQQIYDLQKQEFSKTIFDFPAGIASFNAEASAKGVHVISADPAYRLSLSEMNAYAETIFKTNVAHLKVTPERLKEPSPEMIARISDVWVSTKRLFLQDYDVGKAEKRYQIADLPKLPYDYHQFHLALCSNLLFHHALSQFSSMDVIRELTRVAHEVRIFPLLNECGEMTDELGPLMLSLQQQNYGVEVREVPYRLQKAGNAMLRVWARECVVS